MKTPDQGEIKCNGIAMALAPFLAMLSNHGLDTGTPRPHQARDKEPWAWMGLDLTFPEPKKPKIAHVLRYHPGPGCSKAD